MPLRTNLSFIPFGLYYSINARLGLMGCDSLNPHSALRHGLTRCRGALYIQCLLYERNEDSDWPALEERRNRRYLPGDASLFRSPKHHGDPAKVRCGGGSACSRASGTHTEGADDSGFYTRYGRGQFLVECQKIRLRQSVWSNCSSFFPDLLENRI